MDTITSYDDLVGFFAESGLLHQADPAQSLVTLPTKKDQLEAAMYIRWQQDFEVVHFIQELNFELPEERLSEVALAIVVLNHALPLPGFGINMGTRSSYFRVTMPRRPDGSLLKKEIQGLFNLVVRTAAEHLSKLRAVADGADPMKVLAAS